MGEFTHKCAHKQAYEFLKMIIFFKGPYTECARTHFYERVYMNRQQCASTQTQNTKQRQSKRQIYIASPRPVALFIHLDQGSRGSGDTCGSFVHLQ